MTKGAPDDSAPAPVPPPAPESAKERAYRTIRTGIMTGRFPAGSFIEEAQVCALAQVSRTPVREALNRLSAEGVIEQLPRRGAMVRHVTARELAELYEVRKLIEGQALALLCAARQGAPARMHVLAQEMGEVPDTEVLRHVELNRDFHHAMVEAAGNAVMTRIYADLHLSVLRVALSALSLDRERSGTIQAEHRAILDALDAHDAETGRAILEKHLAPIPQLVARLPH
ncbi:GntR family transcriptional regulator [Acidimangrovimonas sediminis]|uniref:GntR family transcriptional regulator n=1 Tax=Acidimangrovimonas sediminis TaxID=2056283 RepID=UPI001304F1B3|nr:GntR family transcriptional regulator [Acidimangrovimonas sediminis]